MKRFFSSIQKCPISITDSAWKKMTEIISKKKNTVSFLFSAVSGGCNGFNYDLKLLDDKTYKKTKGTYSKGKINPTIIKKGDAEVFIDPSSEMHLIGTTIDYITEDYDKGVFENKFIFVPDKELVSSCGCGISFTPKSY